MTRPTSLLTWVAAAALLAALGAALVTFFTAGGDDASSHSPAPQALGSPAAQSELYERAVAIAMPSVVQIETDRGLGSGVVLDGAGDIVTNAHVVAGASRFVVTDMHGRRHAATLRGSFRPDDVAVVHVADAGLRPATFADSSALRVGQLVLAIGNPLGLRSSATQGIVSATSRTASEGGGVTLTSLIQTSAAINPGNSGGALIDLRGRVVGMPTLAASDPQLGGSAPGIGFAVSSNSVRSVVRQLVATGHVSHSGRASLGVDVRSAAGGALVASVIHGGPADRAGVRAGDVIISVAGQATPTVDDLSAIMTALRPGQRVPVRLSDSSGARRTVTVTLGDAAAA